MRLGLEHSAMSLRTVTVLQAQCDESLETVSTMANVLEHSVYLGLISDNVNTIEFPNKVILVFQDSLSRDLKKREKIQS